MKFEFTPDQEQVIQDAVKWYKYGSEQTFEFAGPAGTGKSVVLQEIIRRLKLKEYEYYPMAYTGQASIVMRMKGLHSARSIHSTLYVYEEVLVDDIDTRSTAEFNRPAKKRVFRKKFEKEIPDDVKLFVIDEGYMVPAEMRKDIESFGRKILVCGDPCQLPPVSGEPAYFMNPGIHWLTTIMRQVENSPLLYLATRARSGLPIDVGIYGNSVMVIEDKYLDPSYITAADCVVCGTNKTRDIMNKYVRENLKQTKDDLPVHGDRLICRNNNWDIVIDEIALANGLIGTVLGAPNVSTFNGKTFKIDFMPDLAPIIFDNLKVNYKYFKSDYYTRKAMKDNPSKYIKGEFFEYAYAITTHLVQGAEFNKGVYIEEYFGDAQNQLNYTAITRFRKAMVYVKKSRNFSVYLR